jgi:hypothetical protein
MQYLEPGGQLPIEDAAQPSSSSHQQTSGSQSLRGIMIITRATVENAQVVATQLREARSRSVWIVRVCVCACVCVCVCVCVCACVCVTWCSY